VLSFIRSLPRSLIALYLAVLALRTGSYMASAIVVSPAYLPLTPEQRGLMFALYPIAELAAVMPFGTVCDRVGRKTVLLAAHLVIGAAAVGFAFAAGNIILAGALMLAQGVGAAALISSSLAMVADLSKPDNRARLMAIYDFLALGGLAGGFLVATILSKRYIATDPLIDMKILLMGAGIAFASLLVARFLVKETRGEASRKSTSDMVREVLRRPEVLKLLPVYIPVIAIYGMVLAFTRDLIEHHDIGLERGPLIVALVIGSGLMASMLFFGWLSDRVRMRRPFIAVGLIAFGTLAATLLLNAADLDGLAARWPALLILSAVSGAFPPAILGYLSDISRRETRGTTFGVYSLVFGTGMIVGPLLGGFALGAYGVPGFIAVLAGLVATSSLSTLRLRECADEPARGAEGPPAERQAPDAIDGASDR
jgi:MFS family permease